uniref:Isoprenylcysteine carboxylmethyltransferase family protein n=1 Tax=Anaerolinea thermolimosa TaxID=229919 RepID=A0A7C4KHE7_9CHLR
MSESGFYWVLGGVALYGAIHSFLASHTAKRLAERVFGHAARRFYRLGFVILALLTAPPLLLLPLLLPDRPLYSIPPPWVYLTLALQGLALLGLFVAIRQTGSAAFLGLQQITRPQPLITRAGPDQLVTVGVYRLVRHPIYMFSFILIWLMPVVTWNILALMLGLTLYTFIGVLFEERKLSAEFGAAYEAYRRRTPMVFPRLFPRRERFS